jgi:hypothetical protein
MEQITEKDPKVQWLKIEELLQMSVARPAGPVSHSHRANCWFVDKQEQATRIVDDSEASSWREYLQKYFPKYNWTVTSSGLLGENYVVGHLR